MASTREKVYLHRRFDFQKLVTVECTEPVQMICTHFWTPSLEEGYLCG